MVWLLVPVGAGLIWLVARSMGGGPAITHYATPAPGAIVAPGQPSPSRALQYLQRLDGAWAIYQGSKFIPGGEVAARQVLFSTLDVVAGMAATDVAKGLIAQDYAAQINAKIDAYKKSA